ncbi:zinc finger, CCHC-type, Retrotransposon gag domain protein [Artemisia annua]|uniref:Zinc finger, CCHC-type, Retrotransposon gag domain protein n=1 Tax=Artemisia annua TaxID=35608 RepID=A0A2U1M3U1_ARTAN|nr:zinc finger, CCHC-type, Retrotransposon gag domain protein [Artemisia annua]
MAFRSAATSAEAEDWITHMEKLFQVLGCPDNFKTRLPAFKLEGDALSWWTAHLRTQVGGESYADTCTWATFREIFYNRYFPVSEQQRFEREYGSIYQLEKENSIEYMQRFMRLVSFVGPVAGDASRQARHYKWGLKRWVLEGIVNSDYADVAQCCAAARNIELLHESGSSNKRDRDGNRIQSGSSGQQHRGSDHRGSDHRGRSEQGFEHRGRSDRQFEHRGQFNRGHDQGRQGQRGTDYRSLGRQGVRSGNANQRQISRGNQQNRYSGSGSGSSQQQQHRSGNSSGQQRHAEALPPPPRCTICGNAHPGPCHKATGACYECGSMDHRPMAFRSAATSAEAEDWITHMEKLFQVLGCPDNFKTRLAAFKLEGDALSWWTAHLKTQRFMRLVNFVGPVAGDASRQARHYKWGLKRWVLEGIVNSDYVDVAQCCAAARNIELLHESGGSNKRDRDGNRIQSGSSGQQHRGSDHRGSEHQGRSEQGFEHRGRSDRQFEHRGQFNRGHDQSRQGQRGTDYRSSGRQGDRSGNANQRQISRGNQQNRYSGSGSGSSHQQQHRFGNSSGQQRHAEALPPPPRCTICGNAHPGPCHKATGACYECGSMDHRVKNCPKKTGIVPYGSSQPSTSTGRVHSLTREQAGNSSGRVLFTWAQRLLG